jgi:hypothetical protein
MTMKNGRQLALNDAEPKTRLQLPDGAMLAVGTKQDNDDPTQYGVHLVFTSGINSQPEMDILFSLTPLTS